MEANGPVERDAIRELDKFTLDDPTMLEAWFIDSGGDPARPPFSVEELQTTTLNLVMGLRSAVVLLARELDNLGPGGRGDLETDSPVDNP
jgi:hypothetical protein